MARKMRGRNDGSTSGGEKFGRNRATPARLFKLYKSMTEDQQALVTRVGFGGLLKIGSGRLPVTFSKWLVKMFDPESGEIVIPGRGRIKANAAAVRRITGLPMGKGEVKYEFDGKAINAINGLCNFEDGRSPKLTATLEWLQSCKEANDEYLRRWLMLAICTFLCGSTSLSISPKCYPSLVDLTKVKDLNWCKFVVDTLKTSVGKMGKKDAVLGCQFFLTVLYLDSLELKNVVIPDTLPRVAAWNIQLLNKVIKLDSNTNGTFGKLKLKRIGGVTETTLLGNAFDIDKFISHRASARMSLQKKRKLSQILYKACLGFTEVMGTMISEMSAISEDDDEGGLRRSTQRKTKNSSQEAQFVVPDDEDEAQVELSDEEEFEMEEQEFEASDEEDEYVEDDLEDEDLEDEGVELEDEELHDYDDQQLPAKEDTPNAGPDPRAMNGDTREASGKGGEPSAAATFGDKEEVADMKNTDKRLVSVSNNSREEGPEVVIEPVALEVIPSPVGSKKGPSHSTRGSKQQVPLRFVPSQPGRERLSREEGPEVVIEPVALEVIPSPVGSKKGPSHSTGGSKQQVPLRIVPSQPRRERLRLPSPSIVAEKNEQSVKHNNLDFSPPPFDIIGSIESPKANELTQSNKGDIYYDDAFWGSLSEEQLLDIDEQINQAMAQNSHPSSPVKEPLVSIDTTVEDGERNRPQNLPSSSPAKEPLVRDSTPTEEIEVAAAASLLAMQSCPRTSPTPAYQPQPRRPKRPGRALKSPYIDYAKNDLKCTKIASRVYDVVCSATRRTTRSSSQSSSQGDEIIISYPEYYVSLAHLSESVKPGAKLVNTVAEIGIYALKDRKAKRPVKQILPLRVASFLQEVDNWDCAEVNSAFQRSPHHLDRSQLVMFPVLQNIPFKRLDKTVGHYFLLVLNLREKRFEVLDSMRSLADSSLKDCCHVLTAGIKHLWQKHYPNSSKNIDEYELVDIKVPSQSNNHDCGFHMLMHCEHWDGNNMQLFSEKAIPTIRKMVTYKWLSHPENSIAWKSMLHL